MSEDNLDKKATGIDNIRSRVEALFQANTEPVDVQSELRFNFLSSIKPEELEKGDVKLPPISKHDKLLIVPLFNMYSSLLNLAVLSSGLRTAIDLHKDLAYKFDLVLDCIFDISEGLTITDRTDIEVILEDAEALGDPEDEIKSLFAYIILSIIEFVDEYSDKHPMILAIANSMLAIVTGFALSYPAIVLMVKEGQ